MEQANGDIRPLEMSVSSKRRKNEIILDYAEYEGAPVAQIIDNINNFHQLINREWNEHHGMSWEEKAAIFYESSRHYILDLLYANPDLSTIEDKLETYGVWKFMGQFPPGLEILEFGGGLGGTSQLFIERGHRVTYLDIPGKVMDFAKWRFDRCGLSITVLESTPERLSLNSSYDFIFSDAVFEHLIDPYEIGNELIRHLNGGGFMLLLIDTCNVNEMWPMHRKLDVERLDRIISDNGGESKYMSPERMINLWHKTK